MPLLGLGCVWLSGLLDVFALCWWLLLIEGVESEVGFGTGFDDDCGTLALGVVVFFSAMLTLEEVLRT